MINNRKRTLATMAGALAAASALTASSMLPAFAEGGGSGDGSGGTGTGKAGTFIAATYDDYSKSSKGKPEQGWGSDSINWFIKRLESTTGKPIHSDAAKRITETCNTALKRASKRANKPNAKSRVVGIYSNVKDVNGSWHHWGEVVKVFDETAKPYRDKVFAKSSEVMPNYKGKTADEFVSLWDKYYKEGHDEAASSGKFMLNVCVALNENEPVKPQSPPNKAWVSADSGGHGNEWDTVTDHNRTNSVGADNKYFLNGDKVAAAVNAALIADSGVESFEIIDDYSVSASILDDSKSLAGAKVYAAPTNEEGLPVVDGVARNKGTDVTSHFTLSKGGHSIKAVAKPEYVKTMANSNKAMQYTLVVPFTIKFDTNTMLKANGLKTGDELATCKAGNSDTSNPGKDYINKGAQVIDKERVATNEPKICVYIPPNKKEIVGAEMEGGDRGDKNETVATRQHWYEYRLTLEPKQAVTRAAEVTKLGWVDRYDPLFKPHKNSLTLVDPKTGATVSRSSYEVAWYDSDHRFEVYMTPEWLKANVKPGAAIAPLQLRLSGEVILDHDDKKTLEKYLTRSVVNKSELVINNEIVPSNEVKVNPPDPKPHKDVVAKADSSISVNGKKAMVGDMLYYKLSIDSHVKNKSYRLTRLGVMDDFDERYLKIDEKNVTVHDETGKSYAGQFNVQVKNGIAYVFFKTVDTKVPGSAKLLKGDPQPADLREYALNAIDPLEQPAVDQSLLNHTFTVTLPAKVINGVGKDIRNQALQVLDDTRKLTNVVNNPVIDINPKKDVVLNVGDKSINGKQVRMNNLFLYRLDSSVIPGDRINHEVTDWSITDQLNTAHDRFTGRWAIYTNKDLTVNGKTVKQGERIAGSDFVLEGASKPLFALTDNGKGLLEVKATAEGLKLFSANKSDMSWSAYVQIERIKPSKRVENTLDESFNKVKRRSNTVWTHTPEDKPAIKLIKFDKKSGDKKGDRNTAAEALEVKTASDKVDIVYRVTNTGDVPVTQLKLTDKVTAGKAKVIDWKYPKDWEGKVLNPGESIDVEAVVTDVDSDHENIGTVTGKPVKPCVGSEPDPFAKPVKPTNSDKSVNVKPETVKPKICTSDKELKASDPWHAKAPEPLAETGAIGVIVLSISVAAVVAGIVIAFIAYRRKHSRKQG